MLTLNRRKGERLIIEYPNGGKVIIEAAKVKTSSVNLGIVASKEVAILRGEVLERKDDEKHAG